MARPGNEEKTCVNRRSCILIGASIVLLLAVLLVPKNYHVASLVHRIKIGYCSQCSLCRKRLITMDLWRTVVVIMRLWIVSMWWS